MPASIEQIVMQFKHDVGRAFDPGAILALCRSIGRVWRTRQLDPVATLQGFLLQMLHGNTACSHVPRLLGMDVTAEAYGQARSRLPLEFFQRLLEEVCSRLRSSIDTTSSWHGHRVWVIDGSSCSMPDTPELQQTFGQPSAQAPRCGFPVAHLMTVFHVGTGMLMRIATASWRTHDLPQARLMHGGLAAGDILLADRGFCSFGHLAMLEAAQRRNIDPDRVSFVDALRWLRCAGQEAIALTSCHSCQSSFPPIDVQIGFKRGHLGKP